jgi:hypothetical protein
VSATRRPASMLLLGATMTVQVLLIDRVLPLETNRAVLSWRPFAWWGAAVLLLLVMRLGHDQTCRPEGKGVA